MPLCSLQTHSFCVVKIQVEPTRIRWALPKLKREKHVCLFLDLKRSFAQVSRRKASEKEDRSRAERWRETDCFGQHMSPDYQLCRRPGTPTVLSVTRVESSSGWHKAVCIGFLSLARVDDLEGIIVLWGYPDSVSMIRVLWIRRYTYLNELAARKVHIDSVASLCFVTIV